MPPPVPESRTSSNAFPSLPALPKAPIAAASSGSLPPLPPLEKPATAPMRTLGENPLFSARQAAAPPPPPVSSGMPSLPPLPKLSGDMPTISASAAPQATAPSPIEPVAQAKPDFSKLENSRLAKALEELTSADFDISEPEVKKSAPPVVAPIATPVAVTPPPAVAATPPPMPKPAPIFTAPTIPRVVAAGDHFLAMNRFDDCLREMITVQNGLQSAQATNERLGLIENHKKNNYDSLVNAFEQLQKQLLSIDEKLFKVN
jgi:hypothetical protein